MSKRVGDALGPAPAAAAHVVARAQRVQHGDEAGGRRGGARHGVGVPAERELRAYHAPNVTEHQLLARHWRSQLPLSPLSPLAAVSLPTAREREREREHEHIPVQALAFAELERRVDVVVFRSLFAASLPQARALVVHGHVRVNGRISRFPARRLDPGDLVEVAPEQVATLHPHPASPDATAATAPADKAAPASPLADKSTADEAPPVSATEPSSANAPPEGLAASSPQEHGTTEAAAKGDATRENTPKETAARKPAALDALIKKHPKSLPFAAHPYMAPWMFIPAYLEVCYNTCATVFLRSPLPQPDCVEIPSPHAPDLHALAYEWYSSIKRAKTKRPSPSHPLVVNGRSVRLKAKFDSIVRARLKQERDDRWDLWAARDEAARQANLEARQAKIAAAVARQNLDEVNR
ncbi:mitochondrial 37S ribosomal protein nam9 [Physocladia obscura]|uniref:Mitochondrial 37S ribosomal protein nam9 n=1 Tax=Physocladia obscura TaxID=109957 RepID=A0AAD5X9F8_9FUNG|nr:mitochondrial 37S ribosomal protein nam9 [Physocladia obscura]